MLPLLPFAAGLLTGVAAIKLWRNESTRAGIDKAQEKLRQVAASSVTAIKTTSARLGKRLAPENTPDAAPSTAQAAQTTFGKSHEAGRNRQTGCYPQEAANPQSGRGPGGEQ